MKAINENVSRYSKENHTTKDSIAKSAGIPRSTFYDKISEKTSWTLDEAIALADAMGMTVQQLITMPTEA